MAHHTTTHDHITLSGHFHCHRAHGGWKRGRESRVTTLILFHTLVEP